MTDKIFAAGLLAKRHDNAPEFVTCSLSVKVDEFTEFLRQHSNDGWVNLQVKVGRSGKMYAELDAWRPTPKQDADRGIAQARREIQSYPAPDPFEDQNIPF